MDERLTEVTLPGLIAAFYQRVCADDVLGPVFASAIAADRWPEHLAIINDFWSSVMFKTGRYKRNPFAVHQPLTLTPPMFDRWLGIFGDTCRDHLAAEDARVLHAKAVQIAESLKAGLFFRPGEAE